MGIKGLTNLLAHEAPKSMKNRDLDYYLGHTIAIDTNIYIYQFLIANRSLKNKKGQPTSHILGLLQRTATFLEAGIKPVYVFDGTPPELKKEHAIAERNLKRKEAAEDLRDRTGVAYADIVVYHATPSSKKQRVVPWVGHKGGAEQPLIWQKDLCQDADEDEDIEALRKKLVKPTSQQLDDCKNLFGLVGVPVVQAPGEGEAQCAQLCKEGKAHAVASEDSDCLPFGAPLFLRDFNCDKKKPVKEFDAAKVLKELKLSQDEFVDFCILSGCDYCGSIKGMDVKTALDLIRQYHCIEKILETDRCETGITKKLGTYSRNLMLQ